MQTFPWESRESMGTLGFPESNSGQALREFIRREIGAGMTKLKTTRLNFKTLRTF